MNKKSHIFIKKTEWERMKRNEKKTNLYDEREKYFQSLIDKSQEMIKIWHDSVQGHINKVEKQKNLKLAKDLKMIRDFKAKNKVKNNDEVIKKAKELIFKDSSYGRQLMSALLESKVLEEREAQIKFQNEVRKLSQIKNESTLDINSLTFLNETELGENQRKLNKKRKEKEIADINRAMYEMKQYCEREKRNEERRQVINVNQIKQIIKNETNLQTEILQREKNDIKEYERKTNELEHRANIDKQEERLREVWSKYQDRIKCKEKAVFDKIHRDSSLKTQMAITYKIIEKSNYEKDKKYNDFVESGVAKELKRLNERDQKETESKANIHKKRRALDEENKILHEFKKQMDFINEINYRRESRGNQQFPIIREKPKLKTGRTAHPAFLVTNKQREKQMKIENDKPWSGLESAHQQYAEHATDILRHCRYKHMALKIINDYRKTNRLDEKYLQTSE
ncbi:cilia- and flagella- associated protein 210-like isoform X2 [Danaus plexippus]|uniref:cilia- and flagella- associated protein 210-like isoform X2 n=1 Tax=Danaus plexippus TaxID=13037 RepID=UPI002AAFFCE9|nr:cilia- and flagella- associated protein 210-like isoform X2 [Danaus plexippus]